MTCQGGSLSAVSQSACAHCPWLEPKASGPRKCVALELATTALQYLMKPSVCGAQGKIGGIVTTEMMHVDF